MTYNSNNKEKARKALATLQKIIGRDASQYNEAFSVLESAIGMLKNSPNSESVGNGLNIDTKSLGECDFYCFSDGACRGNPGPGSWGALIQDVNGEVIFEGTGVDVPTTNNKMELTGAMETLKYLLDEYPIAAQKPVLLVSDSKYVLDGIQKWVPGWKARGWKKADKKTPENLELWVEFDELVCKFFDLRYKWVKGHSGYPQNEKCDLLANEALDNAGF